LANSGAVQATEFAVFFRDAEILPVEMVLQSVTFLVL